MTHRTRLTRRIVLVAATTIAAVCLASLASGSASIDSSPLTPSRASALAPDAELCAGNAAFCGAVLRIESSTGTLSSIAAGSHYGDAWGIPATPNDSAGTGWCVDDTHTGFPAGPISELLLPADWTSHDERVAATIISMYGGDRVLPYQPLEIDTTGELVGDAVTATSPTRLRHVAVWLALRSVLVDPAGTPRIDLSTAAAYSDRAGRNPSPIGNSAIPLARRMVEVARRVTAQGGDPVATIEIGADELQTDPDSVVQVPVRVTDPTGRPIPNVPVWPQSVSNVEVTAHASDDRDSRQANSNATLADWPSFDTTRTRSGASVTNMNGVAHFSVRVLTPGEWSASFTAETTPTRLRLFGDDIRAQNNVTSGGRDATLASAGVEGDATQRHIRVVKTSTDPTRSVAGATFALVDADGTEFDRATTGDDGIVEFVVGARHLAPLRIREATAPPGLRAVVGDIDVTAGDDHVATDPSRPTIVTVENEPVLHEVSIAKRVLGAATEPADLSGFTFTITRLAEPDDDDDDDDDAGDDGKPVTVVTGVDGRTPPVQLAAADYDVLEVARPAWWPEGDPLPPARILSIPVQSDRDDDGDNDGDIVVDIDNTFPTPTTTTTTTTTTTPTTPPSSTVPPSTSGPTTTLSPPPPTTPPGPSTTVPPPTTATTTTTTTTAPTTTTTVTPPASTVPPSAGPPPAGPPPGPPLPRTGAPWEIWYRIGSWIVLAGATLFFASTIGLGSGGARAGREGI